MLYDGLQKLYTFQKMFGKYSFLELPLLQKAVEQKPP